MDSTAESLTGQQERAPEPNSRFDEIAAELSGEVLLAIVADRPEILEAAEVAAARSICRPILIGVAEGAGIDPERDPRRLEMLDLLLRLPGGRQLGMREAEKLGSDASWYAALMVAAGRARGALTRSIGITLEAARATLGPSLDGPGVALAWLVEHDERLLVYGAASDPAPSAEELAGAGSVIAESCEALLREPLRLAFLGRSSLEASDTECEARVRQAAEILAEGEPEYAFEAGLTAREALQTETRPKGATPRPVKGRANLLVFPDLDSGKIAVELTERLAGARVAGPLLLGPSRPVTPCLGGTVKEILDLITLVAFEAERGSP